MGKLHKIILHNFKSYKGTQEIGPFDTFSAIIGPNGAGKSNLMDAISFVFGINSQHLRSANLKELINYEEREAYVSAVYVTGETEYHLTRAVSQSGSEYRINDKVVTAQQFTAFLDKQNILVKARNFLVFQGDVEALAQKSSKDLSVLIEQISGSAELAQEYETLSQAYDKTLEEAALASKSRKNLNSEMKQIKEQKEEAVAFEKLVSRRMNVLIDQMLFKLFTIEETEKELLVDKSKVESSKSTLREQRTELESTIKQVKKVHSKYQKDHLLMEREIKKSQTEIDNLDPDLVKLDEEISLREQKIKSLNEANESFKKEKEEKVKIISGLKKEIKQLTKTLEQFESSAEKSTSATLNQDQVIEYNKLKEQLAVRTVKESKELDSLSSKLGPFNDQQARIELKIQENQKLKSNLQEELSMISKQFERLNQSVKKEQDQVNLFEKERKEFEMKCKKIEFEEKEATGELTQVLQSLLEAKVDRKESERELKLRTAIETMKRIFPGVHGRLIDLCQATQKKYELPLSIILGHNIDAIVVQQEKVAVECIRYMREHKIGIATFIPLDSINPKTKLDENLRTFKGARPAIDVVTSEFPKAIQYACSSSLICDSLEIAKHLSYNLNIQVKTVSIDGTIIHKSGLITGGSSKNSKFEEKQVEALKSKRDELMVTLNELVKEKKKLNFQQRESKIDSLLEEQVAIERKLESLKNQDLSFENNISNLTREKENLLKSCLSLRTEIQELENEISTVESEIFSNFCKKLKISSIKDYRENQLKSLNQENQKRLQFSNLISKLSNQLEFEEQQLESIDKKIEKVLSLDLTDLTAKREEILKSKSNFIKSKRDLDTEFNNLEKEMNEKSLEMNRLRKQIYKLESDSNRLESTINEIELQQEKLKDEKFTLLKKCKLEEIQIPFVKGDLEDIPIEEGHPCKVVPDLTLLDENAKNVNYELELLEISNQIEQLAPNQRSTEKLTAVESRIKATFASYDSIRNQAKTARDRFFELKDKRTSLFMEAFKHISEKIDEIYKELTRTKNSINGGTATLSLENVEEPYLGGVKYLTMPPMKRFRDMEQLSGGEKTVAALALLFALHSFRPSPFFILDEVDAALDNQNVKLVANYLEKRETQFIVISLKPSVYERADSLVGVYRDVDINSSKILTLRLSDYAPAPIQ